MPLRKQLAAFATLCVVSGPAAAVGDLADVSIYDRAEDRALPVYRHEGRYYVIGKPGNEYQIRVRNRTDSEILAVASVDGINAVSGETANWEQTGYVLSPHQGYDIKGWRKSLQRVAAFFFTRHENSYATRTGRPDNVGVIGVAVFRKKPDPAARIDRDTLRRQAPYSGAGAASAEDGRPARSAAESNAAEPDASGRSAPPRHEPFAQSIEKSASLGTGHGRSEASRVTYTDFERATAAPAEVIVIHYDTYHNLVAQGVIHAPRVAVPLPEPFPGRFVADPR